ncbi:MAG: hypothetical protein JSS04_05015 [Proteobacteria bacterium]|nr:hypothetical protein [Pseudomonadota bacterium]
MTGFLNHLAGLALGAKPADAAQPSLPSRFAVPPSSLAEANKEPEPEAKEPEGFPLRRRLDDGSSIVREAATIRTMVSIGGPRNGHDAATPLRNAIDGVQHRSASTQVQGAGEPSLDARRKVEVTVAREVPTSPHSLAVAPPIAPEAPVEESALRERGRLAPLSTAAVAARAMTVERPDRPVIQVTIDRVDVRPAAPSPKPRVEARRARPQPAVSLTDYLGGRRGRE